MAKPTSSAAALDTIHPLHAELAAQVKGSRLKAVHEMCEKLTDSFAGRESTVAQARRATVGANFLFVMSDDYRSYEKTSATRDREAAERS